jgi:hypothetical protein
MSCEAPDTGHKKSLGINYGTVSMAQHTVRKEACVLLCEAVQGAFLINYEYVKWAFLVFSDKLCMFYIF